MNTSFAKLSGNLGAAIAFLTLLVNLLNELQKLLIIYLTDRGLSIEPLVVTASTDPEYSAHLLDTKHTLVIFYKPEYLLSLLEKMLTAGRPPPFLGCHALSLLLVVVFSTWQPLPVRDSKQVYHALRNYPLSSVCNPASSDSISQFFCYPVGWFTG